MENKNRLCDIFINDPLLECSKKLTNIKIIKLLGEGTSGKVFYANATIGKKEIPISIKVIKCKNTTVELNNLDKEIQNSISMSEKEIGPKIYDFFYIKNSTDITQYIIMEYFDNNVEIYLENNNNKNNTRVYSKMIELLKKQNNDGLYCFDIKPENFVINNNNLDIKMIDFDGTLCVNYANEVNYNECTIKLDNFTNEELIYLIEFIQLYCICVENYITEKYKDVHITYDVINFDDIFKKFKPFLEDDIFQRFHALNNDVKLKFMNHMLTKYPAFKCLYRNFWNYLKSPEWRQVYFKLLNIEDIKQENTKKQNTNQIDTNQIDTKQIDNKKPVNKSGTLWYNDDETDSKESSTNNSYKKIIGAASALGVLGTSIYLYKKYSNKRKSKKRGKKRKKYSNKRKSKN